MTEEPRASAGGAVGAVILGLVLALLGYVVAMGQAMMTAPTGAGPLAALAMVAAGAGLVLLGLAALWTPRLRPVAGKAARIIAVLLIAAFLIGKAVSFIGDF